MQFFLLRFQYLAAFKIVFIKALYNRATKIRSNQKLLNDQTKTILPFMSWNGFPNFVSKQGTIASLKIEFSSTFQ